IGRQRGTEAAATVENDLAGRVRVFRLHIAFNDSLADVLSAGDMVLGPLAFFTDVDQVELFAAIKLRFDLVYGQLTNARLRILNDLQETRGMLLCHDVVSSSDQNGSFLTGRRAGVP